MNKNFWGRCVQVFCILFIAYIVIGKVIGYLFPTLLVSEKTIQMMEEVYGYNILKQSWLQRTGICLLQAIGSALFIYLLTIGIKIAGLFRKNTMYTAAGVSLFIRLKKMILISGTYSLLLGLFGFIILMPKTPVKSTLITMASLTTFYLIGYGVIAAITALVRRNVALQDDQHLII